MNETISKSEEKVVVVKPNDGWFDLKLGELWKYRYLIYLLVRRDFLTFHKQTIFGPLWYVLRPLITAMIFTLVFSRVAKISTDGIPPFLFYLSGTIMWSYFGACLSQTSSIFAGHAHIFGKIYFPRLVVPISASIFNLLQLLVRFIVFLGFFIYYIAAGIPVSPNNYILLFPILILQVALLGTGLGILVSSLTIKYRDLMFAMEFVVQGLFFMTPVFYPVSIVSRGYRVIYMLNPMASVIELFRYSFLGRGTVDIVSVTLSWVITIFIFTLGVILFNRADRTFLDTI